MLLLCLKAVRFWPIEAKDGDWTRADREIRLVQQRVANLLHIKAASGTELLHLSKFEIDALLDCGLLPGPLRRPSAGESLAHIAPYSLIFGGDTSTSVAI